MLTVEKLREAKRLLAKYSEPDLGASPTIYESSAAIEPRRRYPRRKAKNASHLRRMNNKWLRRYGYKPAIFVMQRPFFGGGPAIIVHPALAHQVRNALGRSS